VPSFSESGAAPLPDHWWTAFDDATLSRRIEAALAGNFSLAAAWERLSAAAALARRERADLYPDLDGFAEARRTEVTDENAQTRFELGVQASYEVDLWGRIESAAEAERLRAAATAADYRVAALTLSAEVALAWCRLIEAHLQLQLLESQLETNQTVLEVLEKRFAVGQSGSADVLRQRQLVEATREQIIVARARIAVLEHQLAVLEGRPPQAPFELSAEALPEAPPLPATGLPADLVQRRPDVESAFLRLQAADEEVAVAVAEQYPRLNLTASLSTAAEDPGDLFSDYIASVAGAAVAPLLDAGERRAEVERTEAVRRERLAAYGQTVLDAFREVEDALAQEADQLLRMESLRAQLALADSTYEQLRFQYLNGAADFIDVLTALRQQQELQRNLLSARLDRLRFRIALYRALAGGFETPRERTEARNGDTQAGEEGDTERG
jgi:NodT family efflux transporter outer membrane factor (OMF) lipoprotein